jgi:hypothetical protein
MTKKRLAFNVASLLMQVAKRLLKAKRLLARGKRKDAQAARALLDEIGQLLCLFHDVHKQELP